MFKVFQAIGLLALLAGVVGLGVSLARLQPNVQAAPKIQPVAQQALVQPQQAIPPAAPDIHVLYAVPVTHRTGYYAMYSMDPVTDITSTNPGSKAVKLNPGTADQFHGTLSQVDAFILANPNPDVFLH